MELVALAILPVLSGFVAELQDESLHDCFRDLCLEL